MMMIAGLSLTRAIVLDEHSQDKWFGIRPNSPGRFRDSMRSMASWSPDPRDDTAEAITRRWAHQLMMSLGLVP